MNVFVYGTLKQGFGNHRYYLNRSPDFELIAELPFKMVSLGGFPALIPDEKEHQIVGEIYNITEEELKALDRLEGYPGFYDRKEIDLHDYGILEPAWIYYIHSLDYEERDQVVGGNWK